MQVVTTEFDGLIEITPSLFDDNRGWFYEFFKLSEFDKQGIPSSYVQENQSFSKKGVVRGLHYQMEPFAQAKLVTVLSGRVLDVVVDLRKQSTTFKQVYFCPLDSKDRKMLYVPTGFAHGFVALEDSVFHYKCSSYYNKQSEGGIIWNDPSLKIDWPVSNPIVSDKDNLLPTLEEFLNQVGGF